MAQYTNTIINKVIISGAEELEPLRQKLKEAEQTNHILTERIKNLEAECNRLQCLVDHLSNTTSVITLESDATDKK